MHLFVISACSDAGYSASTTKKGGAIDVTFAHMNTI